MKAGVTLLLLLFLFGCEHSSQTTLPPVAAADSTHDTLTSFNVLRIAHLASIGTRSDSLHAIDFVWKDSAGKLDSLSNYRGTKVLINFWATWCPPCQDEIPDLEAVAHHSGDSIKLIGVALDDLPPVFQTVRTFANSRGINYQIVLDSTASLYFDYLHGKSGIPQSYIIARDGTVKFVLLGPQSAHTFDSCLARAN